MSNPIYGLSLIPDGEGGFVGQKAAVSPGYGAYSVPMGDAFVDRWRRDRAPSPIQLIRELVGIGWSCACLNANLIAGLNLRLYVKTRKGQPKHRYVDAFHRQKGYSPTCQVSQKTANYLGTHAERHFVRERKMEPGYSMAGDVLVEEVMEHPLLDLLREPETTQDDLGLSGFDHRWSTQLFMESLGRAYWLIEPMILADGSRVPRHLWMLHSQYVTEIPDVSGINFLSRYEYGSGAGRKETYNAEDVIKLHIPDLSHLRLGGHGPLMAAYEKLGLVRKGDAQINSILENMGFPGLIATAKQSEMGSSFGPAEARRMQSALNALLRQGGYGGTVVLPEALELIFPHWKPNETMTLERYKQYKEDILGCFDIPTSVLQRNDSNLASAKTGDYAHAKYAGVPRATRYEWTVNTRLVPLFDKEKRMFVAFDNVIPDDQLFELEQLKVGGTMGVFEVNELRRAAGYHEIDGPLGEARYINGNLIGEDGVPIMAVQQGPSPGDVQRQQEGNDREKKYFILAANLDARLKMLEGSAPAQPVSVTIPTPTLPPPPQNGDAVAHLSQTVRELVRSVEKLSKRKSDGTKTGPVAAAKSDEGRAGSSPAIRTIDRARAALVAAGYSEEEISAKKTVPQEALDL